MKPIVVASLLILTLAACGGPSDEDVLTEEKIRASESAPVLPDVELSENPEPPPAPPEPEQNELMLNELDNAVENEVIEAGVPGVIPPAFQALWGVNPSDCRAGDGAGNPKMITGDHIQYARSVGALQGVLDDSPGRFEGRFLYDGGEERREQLSLAGGRNILVRNGVTYRRCGAGEPTG